MSFLRGNRQRASETAAVAEQCGKANEHIQALRHKIEMQERQTRMLRERAMQARLYDQNPVAFAAIKKALTIDAEIMNWKEILADMELKLQRFQNTMFTTESINQFGNDLDVFRRFVALVHPEMAVDTIVRLEEGFQQVAEVTDAVATSIGLPAGMDDAAEQELIRMAEDFDELSNGLLGGMLSPSLGFDDSDSFDGLLRLILGS
jgi:hypothetical protein